MWTVITKTYLCNFDPLKPHFYIVKLGFTGVYIIFLISAQNIDCGYSCEPPRRSGSNLCFVQKYEKYLSFLSENFQFLEIKFSIYYAPRRISGEHIVAASSVRPCVRASVRPCVRASVPLLSTQILGNCLSDFNETSWEY